MVKRVKFTDYNETALKRVIDKQSVAWNEAKQAERGKRVRSLYASDVGQCMKKIWCQFFPEKFPVPEFDPRVLRIFHNGNDVHERLSEYLRREEAIGFRDEVDVPRDDLGVHGRCDGICTVNAQAVVVEFKSINRRSVAKPKDEHVGQITWYMAMWRKLRHELKEDFGFKEGAFISEKDLVGITAHSGRTCKDLSEEEKWVLFTQGEIVGELIYEAKQNQQTYHFSIDWDQLRYERVRLWFEQLKWHVENEVEPTVRYDKEKFPCSWGRGSSAGKCPYFDKCWGLV